MRTNANDLTRVRDPAIELLLSHTGTLTDGWCSRQRARRQLGLRIGEIRPPAKLVRSDWTGPRRFVRPRRKPDLAEPGVKSPPVRHGGDDRWVGAFCDKSEVTCTPDSAVGTAAAAPLVLTPG